MKDRLKQLAKAAGGLSLCLALTLGQKAEASGQASSFNITNCLAGVNGSITSWPTNTTGTNGIGILTGGPVNVSDADGVVLTLKGYNQIQGTTNAAVGVFFLTSTAAAGAGLGGGPQVTYGTNVYSVGGTNISVNDWSTTGFWVVFSVPGTNSTTIPTLAANGGVNVQQDLRSQTNIVWGVNWLGVGQITNNFGTGQLMTNVTLSANIQVSPVMLKSQ